MKKMIARCAIKLLYNKSSDEVKKLIEMDTVHKSQREFSLEFLEDRIRAFPQYRNIFEYRISSEKSNGALFKLASKALFKLYPTQKTVEIHTRSGKIGGGLWLPHRYCVINAESIGERVSVLQGVTIGADSNDGRPTIGSDVVIYPNAVVVGNITIGDHVWIGANTFVNYDVPDNSTVYAKPSECVCRDKDK